MGVKIDLLNGFIAPFFAKLIIQLLVESKFVTYYNTENIIKIKNDNERIINVKDIDKTGFIKCFRKI